MGIIHGCIHRALLFKKTMKKLKNNFTEFSFKNAFKDGIRSEPMVSLGNSFELLVLVNRIG
jgi:hypothetical protein